MLVMIECQQYLPGHLYTTYELADLRGEIKKAAIRIGQNLQKKFPEYEISVSIASKVKFPFSKREKIRDAIFVTVMNLVPKIIIEMKYK